MNDHRLTDRLTKYWNNLRGNQALPDFGQLNVSAIEDIWQQCILFTVLPVANGKVPPLNFHTIGDKLREIYGQDALGKTFNPAQRHFQGAAVVRKIDSILANPEPIVDNGQFIGENSKIVKYRSCLLPFGRLSVVTHVVVGLSWREF